jgi:hypothetical protein
VREEVSPGGGVVSLTGDGRFDEVSVRRRRKGTTMAANGAPTYRQLLAEAFEIGRLDGRFAAAFEAPGEELSERCLGRTPEAFARLLWDGRPGDPPAGLEQNAPHWYASGFADGLAEQFVADRTRRSRVVR